MTLIRIIIIMIILCNYSQCNFLRHNAALRFTAAHVCLRVASNSVCCHLLVLLVIKIASFSISYFLFPNTSLFNHDNINQPLYTLHFSIGFRYDSRNGLIPAGQLPLLLFDIYSSYIFNGISIGKHQQLDNNHGATAKYHYRNFSYL